MARNPHASYEASDHQRMPIIPIANNLTTTTPGYALDATQGRYLAQRGANTTSSFSKEVTATGSAVTVGTIQVPNVGQSYLVLSYMRLNASLNIVYNHHLSGRVVRTSAVNGGGSVNYVVVSAGSNLAVQCYLPSGTATAMVDYNCIRLM